MAKKQKTCSYCDGLGAYPFCPQCYNSSDITVQHHIDVDRRHKKSAERANNFESDHWKQIARHKFLENCKVLKNMLRAALRSRKMLTGVEGADELINNIISKALAIVHDEIDCEEWTTYAEVINRFDFLISPEGVEV